MPDNYKAFYNALKFLTKKQGRGAQKRISEFCGVGYDYVNAVVKGRRKAGEQLQWKIAQYYHMSYEDMLSLGRCILEGKDPEEWGCHNIQGDNFTPGPDMRGTVPLISWVQAGAWTEVVEARSLTEAEMWIGSPVNVSSRAFALRVKGDSMEPKFSEGNIIIVDPSVQPENNDYVVAMLSDANEATFKRLWIDGGIVQLRPVNERYPELDMTGKKFQIIGVVKAQVQII